jgi:hypothetical protein
MPDEIKFKEHQGIKYVNETQAGDYLGISRGMLPYMRKIQGKKIGRVYSLPFSRNIWYKLDDVEKVKISGKL